MGEGGGGGGGVGGVLNFSFTGFAFGEYSNLRKKRFAVEGKSLLHYECLKFD